MNKPLITVFTPTYNRKHLLPVLYKSLCTQTSRDFVWLIIDDGSDDGSAAVLDEHAAHDARFVVLHIEGAGVSAARNLGIAKATGDYIGFVDADDFIDRNYYSHLYGRAKDSDADMCMTALVCECNAKGEDIRHKRMGVGSLTEAASARDRGALILASGVTWNKIYRNAFLTAHKLHYSEGACAGEDKIFAYTTLFHTNSVPIIRSTAYHYRQSESSTAFKPKGRESFAISFSSGSVIAAETALRRLTTEEESVPM